MCTKTYKCHSLTCQESYVYTSHIKDRRRCESSTLRFHLALSRSVRQSASATVLMAQQLTHGGQPDDNVVDQSTFKRDSSN
jgi:hypothetical protein